LDLSHRIARICCSRSCRGAKPNQTRTPPQGRSPSRAAVSRRAVRFAEGMRAKRKGMGRRPARETESQRAAESRTGSSGLHYGKRVSCDRARAMADARIGGGRHRGLDASLHKASIRRPGWSETVPISSARRSPVRPGNDLSSGAPTRLVAWRVEPLLGSVPRLPRQQPKFGDSDPKKSGRTSPASKDRTVANRLASWPCRLSIGPIDRKW